jgi:TRAP transporter 4TM/12TM fusion protein
MLIPSSKIFVDLPKIAVKELNVRKTQMIKRELHRLPRIIFFVTAISFSLFHLYTAYYGVLAPMYQRFFHLYGALLLCYLLYKPGISAKNRITILGWGFIFLTGITGFFFISRFSSESILNRGVLGPDNLEIWAGIVLAVLILEATRRSIGLPIVLVALLSIAYGVFGPYMPEFIAHKGYSVDRLITYLIWTTEGVFGIPLTVSATFVVIFIIFGTFLEKLGGGEFFTKIALSISGNIKGGPAQSAVISSCLMGTISGSAVSNVVTTGTFTIPLMIRTGYTPLFAGAVEAVASTGGQIMPPVMGAAAFVMAEMTGISYSDIVISAAIPAILYFVSIGFTVYLEANKLGLKSIPKDQLPNLRKTFQQGFYFFLPLIILVYLLVIEKLSPMKAGIFTILILLPISVIGTYTKDRRIPFREIIGALEKGAETVIPVALACATAGIVIGVVSLTGLGIRFTHFIISFSAGSLPIALVLTMIACLVLGMALPTTAAYIITAILVAPALTHLGVPTLAAHLFVFYFAIISFITPPVAISAYAASGISGEDPMKTGFMAFRLGIVGFIVPFMFVYGPSLILIGSPYLVIINFITALLGVFSLASSLEGWIFTPLSWWKKGVLFLCAIVLITPNIVYSIAGLIPFSLILFYQKKNAKAVSVSE